MSVEPSTDSMTATAAPLSMQCAHGYSGCSGVLSIGCQVARVPGRVAVEVAVADRG